MKKLLLTTALTFVAFGSAASAQSVLERVLGKIDNATNLASVNGTFANIAENLGGTGAVTVYTSGSNVITEAEYLAAAEATYRTSYGSTALATGTHYVNPTTGAVLTAAQWGNLSAADKTAYQDAAGRFLSNDGQSVITAAEQAALPASNPYSAYVSEVVPVAGLAGVNGSINNVIDGITDVTQQATAGTVTAIEYNMPTFDFGDMATTALGAVNTGEITLGVNSSVDNAKTSTTEALSSVMTQMGGSADTGALVLNVASNMTGINGSINNTMEEINGSMGNLSTTALGAVNTGTIISGVNAAVNGITGAKAGQ